jgi:hypothetical protein
MILIAPDEKKTSGVVAQVGGEDRTARRFR